MSLIISNIALHFLTKKEETGEVVLRLGPENVAASSKIESFVDALHKIYNSKGSKAYGHFSAMPAQGDKARFVDIMESYLGDSQSFHQFSSQAGNLLKNELEKYDLAETGYLIVCHYEYMGGRYLLAAIIPISEHYSVDGDLHISADQHLDTNKLQLAARIDLFDYQNNAQGNRYISFIKGRAGRKVSDFFLDFLSCEEGLNSKEQTQTLVQAVEDYVAVNQFDANEKQHSRKELLSYCKEQKESAQDVSLQEISDVIKTEESGQDFYKFCQEQSYPIEESFPHDQTVVNKVTKYAGYGNGISLSFERSHFGQDVVYNLANESITIYKVPPNLKDQLLALIESNANQSASQGITSGLSTESSESSEDEY
ncbi:nucleoid-associated protein YejK [Colwellia sp. MB3u-70]|uniref:nucleoid-associated protein YejK n=1 Tax=unclassified Colwellia TaxID=196834 RepID=UPI0015F5DA57|nr:MULTISPECIES: nucleoid-associated protein YejK [unclassified Colwellia]MBA6291418.1 nucleoid-associated protein YejK [Colwellia sp. MB3u-8]MBA6305855.1 nucleoid-associated protein YejK [Colwellia sp. MB3u-70]